MARRILILSAAPFHDAAMLVGPLAARRALLPADHVTVATVPGVAEIVRALGIADDVWETADRASGGGGAQIVHAGALLLRAYRSKFSSVVDLFPSGASMVAALAASGLRHVSASPRYTEMVTGGGRASGAAGDPVERIAGLIGVATVAGDAVASLDRDADAWLERALGAIGYDSGPVVVVQSRGLWPRERFLEIAERLRAGYGAWIVALDAPRGERTAARFAEALDGRLLAVASPTGARFLAALARASILVTDDAGTATIATFLGVPSVAIVSSGEATPPTLHDRIVLAAADAARVDPEAVFDAASKLVGKPRSPSLFR